MLMTGSRSFDRRWFLSAAAALPLCSCTSHIEQAQEHKESSQRGQLRQKPTVGSDPVESPQVEEPSLKAESSDDHFQSDSLSVLVNKHHPLEPIHYHPQDLVSFGPVLLRAEAAEHAQALFLEATRQGLSPTALSGYRSYEDQVNTYKHWVNTYGKEQADTASARPGYSEHQTGLALDIGSASGGCNLAVCFSQTPEAQWFARQAHRFGFILRFPYWKHEFTGYFYESWHFRYIGAAEAQRYYQSHADCLETFWGFGPAPTYL
ncbi:M15 family metallopeptidase [Rothia sp. P6271]|uniref:M15 family metallopeptidase n=1 Tax=Rothia sp. P6271 TaxID=3402659 RepID=UPI003ACD5FFC